MNYTKHFFKLEKMNNKPQKHAYTFLVWSMHKCAKSNSAKSSRFCDYFCCVKNSVIFFRIVFCKDFINVRIG